MADYLWYDLWTEEEFRDAYIAYIAAGQLGSVGDGLSSSQLQQNYQLHSATVNSDGDPFNSSTGHPPHNASFNQAPSAFSGDPSTSNAGFPENASEFYPNEDHPHSIHGNQPEFPHTSDRSLVCEWRGSRGPCGQHLNEEEVADHMASSHLPPPGRTPMKCQWDKCKLKGYICRDTIIRHIRQIHLQIKPRRQS